MEIISQSDAYLIGLEGSNDSYIWGVSPWMAYRDRRFGQFLKEKGVLAEERRLKESHYVLYHYAHGMHLYRDLIRIFEGRDFAYMRPPSKRFNGSAGQIAAELKTGEVALRRFRLAFDELKEKLHTLEASDTELLYHVLRGECSDALVQSSLSAMKAAHKDIDSLFHIDDHRPSVSRELISCSPSIFSSEPGESTWFFWHYRDNVHHLDKSELLAGLLGHYGISQDHLPELLELQELIESEDHAIIAFYLPKDPDLIDRTVYVAEPFGEPSKVHKKASKLFAQLQTEPRHVKGLAHVQMRLVVRNDDLLNPESGIRIKVFDEIGRSKLAVYNERLAQWAASLEQTKVA